MKSVLLGGGFALLFSLLGTRVAIPWFTRGVGPGDPRRRPDQPPHQARHAHDGWAGHHRLGRVGYFRPIITQNEPSASALLLLFLFVGLGAGRVPRRLHQDQDAAEPGPAQSSAKMIGQTVVALVFGCLRCLASSPTTAGRRPASTHVSFLRDIQWLALPTVVAIALFWVIITGTSNAMNLIDGLDGLSTGASILVFAAYTLVNIWQNNQNCATDRRPDLLRGPRPARPRRRRGGHHRRLLRVPLVERLARRRSSWATPARWRSAAPSPGWPS